MPHRLLYGFGSLLLILIASAFTVITVILFWFLALLVQGQKAIRTDIREVEERVEKRFNEREVEQWLKARTLNSPE